MSWFWLSCIDRAVPNCFHLVFSAIVTSVQFLRILLMHPILPYSVLFQQRHMENIMDSTLFRKLQLVRLLSDRMKNPEWPKKLCLQLLVAFRLNIFAVQSNFFAGGVAPRFDSLIMSFFWSFWAWWKFSWQIIISSLSSAYNLSADLDWERELTSSSYNIRGW